MPERARRGLRPAPRGLQPLQLLRLEELLDHNKAVFGEEVEAGLRRGRRAGAGGEERLGLGHRQRVLQRDGPAVVAGLRALAHRGADDVE